MVEFTIIRPPTKEEQQNMVIIGKKTPRAIFTEKLFEEKTKAGKKGLPFADQVAREDWDEHNRQESRRLLLKYHTMTLEALKEYKQPEIDWEKYSDLNNFKVVGEQETRDDDLSKRNNIPVFRRSKIYMYKEYSKRYQMMNSEQEALMEAKRKHDEIWNKTVSSVPEQGKDKSKARK